MFLLDLDKISFNRRELYALNATMQADEVFVKAANVSITAKGL